MALSVRMRRVDDLGPLVGKLVGKLWFLGGSAIPQQE